MKVPTYDEELEAAKASSWAVEASRMGEFYSEYPKGSSEFEGYLDKAVELVCKAFDFPKVEGFDWGEPGFRFDGYQTDTFTFTVYFRLDKDLPFMVRFDGITHDERYTDGWLADSTSIHSWEV